MSATVWCVLAGLAVLEIIGVVCVVSLCRTAARRPIVVPRDEH